MNVRTCVYVHTHGLLVQCMCVPGLSFPRALLLCLRWLRKSWRHCGGEGVVLQRLWPHHCCKTLNLSSHLAVSVLTGSIHTYVCDSCTGTIYSMHVRSYMYLICDFACAYVLVQFAMSMLYTTIHMSLL